MSTAKQLKLRKETQDVTKVKVKNVTPTDLHGVKLMHRGVFDNAKTTD